MSSTSNKSYPTYFSPLQMFYNYANNINNSIKEFFKQYLKPQGKQSLLLFNRYMLIITILNVDIYFLIAISLIVFIVVKLIKTKPWQKQRKLNLPVSCVDKIYGMKNDQNLKNPTKIQQQKNDNFSKKQTKQSSYQQKYRLTIQNTKQKQQLLKDVGTNDVIIRNFSPSHSQQQIYQFINKIISGYCRILWFIKWKSILIFWIIIFVINMFEPSKQYDTFKITTKRDGELQIGQIKKASQHINYFHLIIIWIVTNLILFCYYGTKQLKRQLLLEVYTKQYTIDLIKKRKLKISKSNTKTYDNNFITNSYNIHKQQPFSPQFYSTFLDKTKTKDSLNKKAIQAQQSNTQPKNSPTFSLPQSQRKFSHDLPQISKHKQHLNVDQNKNSFIQDMFENSFVQSQEAEEEEQTPVKKQNKKQKNVSKQKIVVDKQNKKQNMQQFDPKDSLSMHQNTKKKPYLQKKNFLQGVNSQNLLEKTRKSSDQFKTHHQKYNDFKINLFKVQQSLINNQKKK